MSSPPSAAFARLRHDLLRRRWRALEPRLRLELVALALGLGAFIFWQLRVLFAALTIEHDRGATAWALGGALAATAVLGGVGTGWRLHRRLTRTHAGPHWLALPIPAEAILRHLAWEAETPVRALGVVALAAWCAAAGLATPVVWLLSPALLPLAWLGCCRAGEAAAIALAPRRGDSRLASLAGAWEASDTRATRAGTRAGRWHRGGPAWAVWIKDAMLARRAREPRAALAAAFGLAAAAVALGRLPALSQAARSYSFILALLSAASFGETLILIGDLDPFPLLRALPIGVAALWAGRIIWVALVTIAIVATQAWAVAGAGPALHVSLAWLGIATLLVTTLAVHLQLTLYPRANPAVRLYGLALALAVVSSLMIPLLGWVILLAGVGYTARRLSRWWTLEDVA